jgi:hypothetical protein
VAITLSFELRQRILKFRCIYASDSQFPDSLSLGNSEPFTFVGRQPRALHHVKQLRSVHSERKTRWGPWQF